MNLVSFLRERAILMLKGTLGQKPSRVRLIRACDRGNNNISFADHILERKNLISNIRVFFRIVFFSYVFLHRIQ